MLALDAEIHIKGPRGDRRVRSSEFFKDLFTVDLGPGELIVAVSFAPVRSAAYAKLHQRASHYAIVGVAAAMEVSGGTIMSARVGITGAGSHAVRLTSVEAALAGKPATSDTCNAAAVSAGSEIAYVTGDLHASSEYRKAMIPVFTRRALQGALARV
jgi:carbon-monoxide dehydrogenase medium subunit